ncbi:hypothetical protein MWU77_08175 [Rhodococcus sp. F64268]|nr:hypothetical protein [Rhodococcus sp. F64268]MCK0090758.1 hypothetical protein [Rhodococcus sp. F64268]
MRFPSAVGLSTSRFRDLDNHVWEVMWMDVEAAAQQWAPEEKGAQA